MRHEKQIEELLSNDSFVRWIEGEASYKEASKWLIWLQDDPARKRLVRKSRIIHDGFGFVRRDNRFVVEEELSKLNYFVNEIEKIKDKRNLLSPFSRPKGVRYYSRIAAGIVLLISILTVSYFYYREPEAPVKISALLNTHTEFGQKKILTFSDGSSVTLNAHSSLKYPAKYSGGDFNVWLKGEAYFNIVHKTGPDRRTFTVHTQDGKVEVLGTKFNVNTYDSGTDVVLERGKVRIELKDSLNQPEATAMMMPGEMSHFIHSSRSIEISKVKPAVYISWLQNKLIFDREPLAKIAKRIEHIYGLRFPISSGNLKQTKISGSVPNDNLPVLLKALAEMLGRSVSRKNGTIRLGPIPANDYEE